MSWVFVLMVAIAGVYLGLVLWLILRQRRLIFRAGPNGIETPSLFGASFEHVRIPSRGGKLLAGWWLEHADGVDRPALLYCHGNAATLSMLAEVAAIFHAFGWDVLLFDYQGYGESEGPVDGFSEAGLVADGCSAYDWLAARAGVERIIVWGHSLGSAVAAAVAAQRSPRGLILEGAFPELPSVARRHYPWVPFHRRLLFDKFAVVTALKKTAFPVLVIHAERDEIVSAELGRELYEALPQPKEFLLVPVIGHTEFPSVARQYAWYFEDLGRRWTSR